MISAFGRRSFESPLLGYAEAASVAAPPALAQEALPCEAIGVDLATPFKIAVWLVVTVFHGVLDHTDGLAHETFVRREGRKMVQKLLALVRGAILRPSSGD